MRLQLSAPSLFPAILLFGLTLLVAPGGSFAGGDAPPVQTGGGGSDPPAATGSGTSSQSPLSRGTSIMPELPPKMPEADAEAADKLDGEFAFGRMKLLEGEWTGTSPDGGGATIEVDWRVTAGGSALIETQFPGTDQEMVSVYYVDDGELVMTHFCAMGNQPRLRFEPGDSSWNVYSFAFDGGANIVHGARHVHSGTIRFIDVNRLRAEWTIQAGSKKSGSNIFELERKTVRPVGG